jgi:hypothetical protein
VWVTNGHADNMSGTSGVPEMADELIAPRKPAEVGQVRTSQPLQEARKLM